MGYYIRVLATSVAPIPLDLLSSAASPAVLEQNASEWDQLILKHPSGVEIAMIERNPVIEGELGAEELQEFLDEVADCKPDSGARWLLSYLPTVKVIYALQLLDGTDVDDGWGALRRVHAGIWHAAGGILQADGEGFSNEQGYTIVWNFSDHVKGEWSAAVLNDANEWVAFRMELGDPQQREQFLLGEVPVEAVRL